MALLRVAWHWQGNVLHGYVKAMHGSDWPRAGEAKKALPRRREARHGGGEAKRWMGTGKETPGSARRGRSMAKRLAVRRRIDKDGAGNPTRRNEAQGRG